LAVGYAAIGSDDLAERELEGLRSRLGEIDYLPLRTEIELLSGHDTAAGELLSRSRVGPDSEVDPLPVFKGVPGIAHSTADARRVIERLNRLEPKWFEDALAGASYPPICMLAWSGDRARARTLLDAWEPGLRSRSAYAATASAAGRADHLARGLACAGRGDDAMMELESLLNEGHHAGGWRRLATHPAYDAIRGQPRFEAIVAWLRSVADGERRRFLARPDLLPRLIEFSVSRRRTDVDSGGLNLGPVRIALCGFWLLAGIAWQLSARADDQSLEEIVVTGTRIARPNFDAASPIVAVPAAAFERTASGTAETTLNRYPQFVPGYTGTSNNSGSYSEGRAGLNLRGLGDNRTLTLVDGRRLMPVNGNGETDLNVIPSALIDSVEIVTGGGSAVYGSDAIAGVVNFRLRREFDGVELGGRWGQTDRGDGEEYDVSLTAGTDFAGGRGSVMGYVGYYDRAQINQPAREFSRAPLFYVGPGDGITGPGNAYVGDGSFTTEEGTAFVFDADPKAFDALFESYGYPAGTVPQDGNPIGFNTDGTLFTMGNGDPDGVANFRGQGDPLTSNSFFHTYNTANFVALQMPLTRTSAYASANFELTDDLGLYTEGIYADYTVNTQIAPTPLQGVVMPASNPFIPPDLKLMLDSRPDRDAPFDFLKRLTVNGPRVNENNYDMYQLMAGARGRLPGDWDFDVYAQYGASSQRKYQTGNVSRSKVDELTFAPDGGTSLCGGFNPFGLDSILPECADYIAVDAGVDADVRQMIAEFSARGTPLALPAGDLRMAIGVQYRSDEYQYRTDEALRRKHQDGGADISAFEAADDIDADDHNTDVYVEAAIPLLAGLPGVESLETVLGFRHSDYSSAGGVDAWKAELLYQPATAVRLRGSYQRAVRVPSIFELFLPRTRGEWFLFRPEPCVPDSFQRTGPDGPRVEALCIAQGVPAELLADFPWEIVVTTDGGNPELEPERADTLTTGIVVRPGFGSPWFRNLQFTVDWYRIEIDNTVEFINTLNAVDNCFDPTLNPGFAADNYWCTLFGRDSATGQIVNAVDTYRNLATSMTSGVDLQLDWRLAVGPGELGVGWYVGWVDEHAVETTSDVPAEQFAGTIGGFAGSYPEWKWLMDLRYAWRDLEVGVAWRYVDSTVDTSRFDIFKTTDVAVPHRNYFDFDASYSIDDAWFDGLTIRAGVENLTDEQPPIFPNSVNANTDPSQFDVLGRRYYVTLALHF
jgi:iron complex outermembrane recepter protein